MAKSKKVTTKLPFVSIVALNWNGQRFLKKLLPLLENQSYPRDRYEIIVMDNNSTRDKSVEFVKKNYPDVVLVENPTNDGYAGGMNIGIKTAKGKYIVCLNNDTEPQKQWLEALVDVAETHKHAGAVSSKMLFADRPDIINNAGSVLLPDKVWPVDELGANQKDSPQFKKVREISAICGGSVLFSRKMLQQIGLFDEFFFAYFEDTDLSWRGQKAGWKYYFSPKSILLHEHSGSFVEHSPTWTFFINRNHMLILFKNARLGLAFRALASFIRNFFAVPVYRGLRGRERRKQLAQLRMGFRIGFSFAWRVWPILLKRIGWLPETKLQS